MTASQSFRKGCGLGFRVWGLGFGVWGLGFGVWGLGFGVWGLGFGVWGLGLGLRVEGSSSSRNLPRGTCWRWWPASWCGSRNAQRRSLGLKTVQMCVYIYGTPPPPQNLPFHTLFYVETCLLYSKPDIYIYIYGHISIDIHKIRNSKYLKTPKKFGRARSFKTPLVAKQGVLKLLAPKIED